MSFNLKSMTRKELEKHLKDVKKALQTAKDRDRRDAKKAAEKAAAEFGYSLTELAGGVAAPAKALKKKAKAPAKKSKPQYANPADASQTWTGKGRQPNWYRTEIEKGTQPETMKL